MSETEAPVIGLKEISRRIKEYGIKDEWAVYCLLAGGNHTAAFMLRRCVVWSGTKRVQKADGWFYKCAQDWREEACIGRSALDTATGILETAGLLITAVRQVSVNSRYAVGKTVKHYQLNPAAFYARLELVLKTLTGQLKEGLPPVIDDDEDDEEIDDGMPDSSKTDCTIPTFGDAENQQAGMHESDIKECTEPTSGDDEIVHLNLSLDLNLKSSSGIKDQNLSLTLTAREIEYIDSLKNEFNGFENARDQLLLEYQRVGRVAFDETLERCRAAKGVHWNYVLTSLAAVDAAPPPTPSPVARIESDEERTQRERYQAEQTRLHELQQAQLRTWRESTGEQAYRHWQTAMRQLELQMNRMSFDNCLRGGILLRIEHEVYIVGVRFQDSADACQHRHYRLIRRVLSDVVGRDVELCFEVFQPVQPVQSFAGVQ